MIAGRWVERGMSIAPGLFYTTADWSCWVDCDGHWWLTAIGTNRNIGPFPTREAAFVAAGLPGETRDRR